jgi:hypothetical protein
MHKPLYPQRRLVQVMLFSLVIFFYLSGFLLASDQQSVLPADIRSEIGAASPQSQVNDATEGISQGLNSRGTYASQLKVYVVEPISRYKDYSGHSYEMGFLDFAIDTSLNLEYQVPFSKTAEWDPAQNGVGSIQGDNIMVIAVLFNHLEGHPAYTTDGEDTYPFTAYYSDATAAALPGETGYNDASGDYTHTVFLEEGTWAS